MTIVLGRDSANPPPPVPAPPELPTVEQVSQMIGQADPESWYAQAACFDRVADRLRDAADGLRKQTRSLDELWHGKAATAFDGKANDVAALIEPLASSARCGDLLRRAGDA